ncbi:MAG: hypothetical protein GFH27_549333n75 [Chloroflexi bacterium AL-W]|nr:hypothetical protein [Chloroflexi bacterium AL-N1]NOK70472.1 hypothetical protein [Chloroflexi bacterium AL-N10]NOK78169.1 hypothetical protein [Chloroflexi bacterium AL-N5]NOK85268.1 hypothetical protein [Chloroflexi bacterium AL-W]NOK92033.1 hypothetical protein [Chloroflexi bacterium AL-N15]
MIIQNRDGSISNDLDDKWYASSNANHYYAEVPQAPIAEQSDLVKRIIDRAFDVLGVRHVEVRVHEHEDVVSRGA